MNVCTLEYFRSSSNLCAQWMMPLRLTPEGAPLSFGRRNGITRKRGRRQLCGIRRALSSRESSNHDQDVCGCSAWTTRGAPLIGSKTLEERRKTIMTTFLQRQDWVCTAEDPKGTQGKTLGKLWLNQRLCKAKQYVSTVRFLLHRASQVCSSAHRRLPLSVLTMDQRRPECPPQDISKCHFLRSLKEKVDIEPCTGKGRCL